MWIMQIASDSIVWSSPSLNLLDNILFNLNNCFPSDRLVTGVSGSRCSLRDCHAVEDWWQFCFWIDDVILSWIQIFPWCCGIVTEGHENCSNWRGHSKSTTLGCVFHCRCSRCQMTLFQRAKCFVQLIFQNSANFKWASIVIQDTSSFKFFLFTFSTGCVNEPKICYQKFWEQLWAIETTATAFSFCNKILHTTR